MADEQNLFYKHSGKFSPTAPVAMIVGGGLVGLVAGAVYGVIDWYSPIIYLNLIATVGLGFLVGWVVLKTARATHVRNPVLVGVCGLVAGAAAWYASWVSWVLAGSGWSGDMLILRPDHLWTLADFLAIDGVWGLGRSGEPVSGLALKGVWVIEALIILGIAVVFPYRKIAQTPYSESERAWADHTEVLPALELIPKDQRKAFRQRLADGDFTGLAELAPVADEAAAWTLYQLISTEPDGGGGEHFLTITTVENAVNKKGEVNTTTTHVARNVVIDAESRALIKEIVGERPGDTAENGSEDGDGETVDEETAV